VQKRANELLKAGNRDVKRMAYEAPSRRRQPTCMTTSALREGPDPCHRHGGHPLGRLRIGIDPLGGAAVNYWQPVAEIFGLDIKVVNPGIDPKFGFMTVDHDGKIAWTARAVCHGRAGEA